MGQLPSRNMLGMLYWGAIRIFKVFGSINGFVSGIPTGNRRKSMFFFFFYGVSCIKFAHHAVLGIRFMLVDMMKGTFHFREIVISSRNYHHQFWELIN